MASSVYLVTPISRARFFNIEPFHPTSRYFVTPIEKARYFSTIPFVTTSRYFVTPIEKARYFNTIPFDILDFDNICHYPKKLDIIRQQATLLIWDEINKKLYSSLEYEGWGKIDTKGYFSAGNVRLLLDYLSSIWLERDNDSKSGLVRTSDYYYTKYSINDIIVNFRKCDINVKPIVALFDLNSYSVQDDSWPNYFVINNIINPPTEEGMPTLKQYTDIFSLESLSLSSSESQYSIEDAQIHFPLTKQLKYLTNFSINGSDYIGYVDYNYTSVTYDPPQLNGYTITNSDTVTITYWYEE